MTLAAHAPPRRSPTPPRRSPTLRRALPLAALLLGGAGCGARPVLLDPSLFSVASGVAEPCVSSVAEVAHWDEPTALGFSAVEALQRLAGARSSALGWAELPPSDEYVLEYGPERGASGLTLDLRAREGRLLLDQPAPRYGAPEGTVCPPAALSIPVEVTLQSDGHALDERFDGALEVSVPYQGRLRHTLTGDALAGGLTSQVLSLDPERAFRVGALELEALLWEGGSRGSLSVQLQTDHARASEQLRPPPAPAVEPPPLAVWPSAHACDGGAAYLPSDAKVLGFSALDVLQQLASRARRSLTWSDGSVGVVTLQVDAPEAFVCQELGESLRFGATLHASNDDGSLDLRLPVQVEAQSEGGALGAVSIEGSEPESPHPVPEAAPERPSLRLSGYRALLVALDWTQVGGRDSGSLALRGVDSPTPDAEGRYESSMITNGRW